MAESNSVTRRTLSTTAALRMLAAAVAKAEEFGDAMTIAILDENGLPRASVRMVGSPLAAIDLAPMKARTAISFGRPAPTSDMAAGLEGAPVRTAMMASLPWYAAIGGGYPIFEDGVVIGAVGVGGGPSDHDAAVAEAALAALGS